MGLRERFGLAERHRHDQMAATNPPRWARPATKHLRGYCSSTSIAGNDASNESSSNSRLAMSPSHFDMLGSNSVVLRETYLSIPRLNRTARSGQHVKELAGGPTSSTSQPGRSHSVHKTRGASHRGGTTPPARRVGSPELGLVVNRGPMPPAHDGGYLRILTRRTVCPAGWVSQTWSKAVSRGGSLVGTPQCNQIGLRGPNTTQYRQFTRLHRRVLSCLTIRCDDLLQRAGVLPLLQLSYARSGPSQHHDSEVRGENGQLG